MVNLLNELRKIFFTNFVGEINLYIILSSIFKFLFIFIVLYYIYIIVKLIILDIKNIDIKDKIKKYFIIVVDSDGISKNYLLENNTSIGRALNNDIVLSGDVISKYHAEIVKSSDNYYLVDKNSSNGTFLNGEFVNKNYQLINDDIIEIGEYKIKFVEEFVDPKSN
ncbi:FHA domain-containing protein [Helcococcus ovis]|uniref:FHA domain-containing protein n=5 Tax=Helcococcus ovis TaxID=72026 RepID=A0A4R9C2Z5_9FIRM|nr:FHA domain-containing protein [Helcococcus ovis]TFF66102.1 FHA domain-containing protein [Helcococcus ovis]TFF68412.1 FHA domain-containing protein [Helcococcus ovis]WNZ00467.1 FHA domain-containing protein [Helcococcus ovis]